MLELYSFRFSAMGTACNLHLYAPNHSEAGKIAEAAMSEVFRIEQRYSRYRPDSFLSTINETAARGGTIELDEETAALLDYAYACHKKSEGLFDVTAGVLRNAWDFSSGRLPEQRDIDRLLPLVGMDKLRWDRPSLAFPVPGMELDFGGIGKEYAADRAAAICSAHGIEHGLVDLGGDICVIGPHPDSEPWRIEICHPRDAASFMATVYLARGCIASSGDYERFMEVDGRRYCHILDPRTGWPVRGLSSVSVLSDQCLVAGSVSTIAMLKGENGMQWLKELGIQHLCMDERGKVEGTSPFLPLD
ncbi:MAG TPA: FAD:protein FMN transferase [Gallionella sp.]|nr:FAD:protein FMN transferase [Gallionella sp.]